ncbi:WS/DGAT domain-containing protein [Ideonella sp. BN130291]|uniref:WS/DGAT domain-containing protein n=1 Tax=Ideonella sp. BN130291 TaxID=3112940 RepID=UPI002E25D8C3|nr:WS/DGAT domain-containing protein [Ideonella sp. BN130291]
MTPPPPAARPLSAADHAWLRMDTAQNLVVIHLAFCFDGEVPLAAVIAKLRARLLPHHQFTHRIVRGWWRAHWVLDPQFSIARHLDELWLPPGSSAADLKSWMSSRASHPLPADRPLWQATLVHGVGGHSALVMRVHHCLADGISLMNLISGMTDIAEGEQPVAPARAAERDDLSLRLLLRRAPRVLADAAHMLFMRRDRPSRLKGRPGMDKAVAWSQPLSLAMARDLAHRQGATVNDVMLAVISDVLRRHLQARGAAHIGAPLRTVIPMNMRPHDEAHLLGNRFGLVGLELPVHLADPLQRLHAVRDGMQALKRGFQGQLALALVRVAGRLPAALQTALLGIFSRRCTVIVTNVIGPAEGRSVAGRRMDELMLCVPQGMTVGVGVSIVSYAGELRIGFLVDQRLMPDCAAAAASVRACFEQLRSAACASPATLPAPLAEDDSFWPSPIGLDGKACAP